MTLSCFANFFFIAAEVENFGLRLDLIPLRVDVDLSQQLPDGISADAHFVGVGGVFGLELAQLLFGHEVLLRQIRLPGINTHVAFEIQYLFELLQAHVE